MYEATEVVVEPGLYRAKLKNIEEAERKNFDTGEPEACHDWVFEIVEEGYEGQTLKKRNSVSFGPRSNNRAFAQALLRKRIEPGDRIDKPDLIGKECMINVEHNETDRGTFANIDSVMPIRQKKDNTAVQAEQMRQDLGQRSPAIQGDAATEAEIDDLPDW